MAIRIIVCDDHPVFRAGLVAALAQEPDLDVVGEAGSLPELRRHLDRTGADLVLLDVDVPDGPAVDAVAEVAGEASVVMISANDHADLVRRALRDGALGYIHKDADPAEVLRLVRRAVEGKTALSADMALRLAESLRLQRDRATVEQALASLTPRQREVIALIAEGRTNREIAERLYVSEGTIRNHVARVVEALGVPDRTELAGLLERHQAPLDRHVVG
jgi:two-component system nitrate/nitrite response regulator NarL